MYSVFVLWCVHVFCGVFVFVYLFFVCVVLLFVIFYLQCKVVDLFVQLKTFLLLLWSLRNRPYLSLLRC